MAEPPFDPSDLAETGGPLPTEWFAGLLEPLAALAIKRGVGLPTLVDSLKLALVRAAVAADAASEVDSTPSAPAADTAPRARLSDSRVALMTGVHRKDLRRLRQLGTAALSRGPTVANEVFTRWLAEPAWRGADGEPLALRRQADGGTAGSFESLVQSVTRDVHPRAVLEELLRLQLVQTTVDEDGAAAVRIVRRAFVPPAGSAQLLALAQANLADHVAAICGNLQADGRRFLEQAIYSDELTADSARQFNRETRQAWDRLFEQMMPRLQELYEADRQSDQPRDYRVRLGMYGYAGPDAYRRDDPYQPALKPTVR